MNITNSQFLFNIMDREVYWILMMLSERRISAQMANRLLDALELLRKTESQNTGKTEGAESTNVGEENTIVIQENISATEEAIMDEPDGEIELMMQTNSPQKDESSSIVIESTDAEAEENPSFIQPTIADDETISKSAVNYHNNESAPANEFRRLVRNILHINATPGIKSILITSSTKSEGKSFVAANLAIAIAKKERDKKVLLIDCDLRKPVIHSLFGIKNEPGLVSLILEEAKLNDVIRDTGLENLKIITSGRATDSPSILLPEIKNVIARCEDWFDIILCDSPPVVPVDDAATLGQYTDGVLFVLMAGKTDRMVVKRALEILNDAKTRILGIVLNNAYGTLPYYYDYKYYGYKSDKNGN